MFEFSRPPVYKLYYFTGRGRGEHIRHILRVAGVPFDDVILTPESWPQYKDDMPLGQVPVLEVDGIKIAQSVAIARFLGHKFQLDGRNEVENAQLDMIADLISDALNADGIKQWPYVLLGVIKEDKVEYFKERVEPALTAFAPLIEKFLANNNKYGVLIGDKETWVDIFVAEFFSKFIDFGREDCLNAYPHILAHIRRIHSLPPIRDHIRNRLPTLA